jgi:hypothetical protein
MTRLSIIVPAGIAASLSLPGRSLVDGSATTQHLPVHSLGGYYLRPAIRMNLPLDSASAKAAQKTERRYRVRQYLFRPAFALASLISLAASGIYVGANNPDWNYPGWILISLAVTAIADELFAWLISRSALAQHPRREKAGIRISGIPASVVQEIVQRHPEISSAD